MGYYSMLTGYNVKTARLRDVEEFEKRRAAECEYGFSPENLKITFKEDGSVEDFEFQEMDTKWYDQQEFSDLLSEFLVDGRARFWFEGEDLEQWEWTVFPGLVMADAWEELFAQTFYGLLDKSKMSDKQKLELSEEYCRYWHNILEEAQANIEICKKGGK